jgi:hypothetical protein
MIVIEGTLVGGIVSAQGIGIPDAIAVLSQENKVIDETKSRTNGEIWFDKVKPGKYSISVQAPETKKGDFVVVVKPEEMQFTVNDANAVTLETPFQVFGGSLGGKVVGLADWATKEA